MIKEGSDHEYDQTVRYLVEKGVGAVDEGAGLGILTNHIGDQARGCV